MSASAVAQPPWSEKTLSQLVQAQRAFVQKDYNAALRLLRPLGEQGVLEAQRYLGRMYEVGEGVPQDYAEAVKWYRLAAEQGGAHDQAVLGTMYADGRGVPQNLIQAYKWYSLAAAQADNFAAERDAVRRLMTPAQIAEGQKLAAEWKPKN